MKQGYITSILLINIIFSIEKCGFNMPELDNDRGVSNCTNITMQKTISSPSGLFYIHFDTTDYHSPSLIDNDLDGIPDYINEVSQVADSSYRLLIDTMDFQDGANGNDNITDIFVIELDGSAYGWARPINSCNDSCIEIDNNYEESEYYTNGVDAMKVTLIHEYFHTIQFGYRCSAGTDSYFYELTSTWIEDIGYPDINDYINFMVSSNSNKNYYKYPDQDFDDTNGYSVALFGHYLSTQLENNGGIGYEDELSSVVMNKVWDRIDNTSNTAIAAIDYILESEYSTSFNNAWMDFNTRNLFNQIDEGMYYYDDQSLIEKINIDDYTIIDDNSNNISFGLDYKSVSIPSFSLYDRGKVNINITANDDLLFGNMVIISDTEASSVPLFSGVSQILNEDDIFYFIFGTDESYLSINLNLEPLYVPSQPEGILSLIGTNFVDLWWTASDGIGDISYVIFRNSDSIDTVIDTFFTDSDVTANSQYLYQVTAQNDIGNSNPISINIDTTNPDYPLKPESLFSLMDNTKNHLWWTASDGIGDISYVIFRNSDSIDTVIDTFYYDYNIEPDTYYEYSIYSANKVGYSIEGIFIESTSWPSPESIQKNSIVKIYPNPVDLSMNNMSIILDVKDNDHFSTIILYDINGREITRWNNVQLNKGRQRIELESIISLPISSGLYFISNNSHSIPVIIRN